MSDDLHLIGMMSEIHGNVGVVSLCALTASVSFNLEESVVGNEEWNEGTLRWWAIDNLHSLNHSNSLEGIVFLKNHLSQKGYPPLFKQ